MFALVDDVERYPEFVPWCTASKVLKREAGMVEATLEMSRGGVHQRFSTHNESVPGQCMSIALLGGPFKHLEGGWTFTPLGEAGCKVSLSLDFQFSNRALDALFGRYFEEACNKLVDAFSRRASEIYTSGGRR